MPYTEDPAELAGADVAIVGAPTDDLVSDRPGARFGPRAIRAASCPPRPAPGGQAGRLRRAARRRLRRCAGAAGRPRPHARGDRAHRRRGARRRGGADRPRRGPRDRRARHPRLRARHGPSAWSTSTPTPTPAQRSSASRSRTAPRCTGSSSRATSIRAATCRSGCAATGPASPSSPGRRRRASRVSSCTTCGARDSRRWWSARPRSRRRAGVPVC